jgi:transposase
MDRQTLRDWVHRFNHGGVDGLIDAKSPGRPPKLSVAQQEELRRLVEAGPDPDRDGVVRWRCVDLTLRANDGETSESLKFSLEGEGQPSWSYNTRKLIPTVPPGLVVTGDRA